MMQYYMEKRESRTLSFPNITDRQIVLGDLKSKAENKIREIYEIIMREGLNNLTFQLQELNNNLRSIVANIDVLIIKLDICRTTEKDYLAEMNYTDNLIKKYKGELKNNIKRIDQLLKGGKS